MSSEFSCDYCSASPRHPCYSREEAVDCPNNPAPEYSLELSPRHVALWLKLNWNMAQSPEDCEVLRRAMQIVESEW